MFYPFCDASELKISNTSSYCAKIKHSGVIDITHQNIALIEPFSELVHAAFAEFEIGLIGIPFCSRRMMKMTMLSETGHDEHEQDIYEDNNRRDLCHKYDNLPGQVANVIELSPLTLSKDRFLIL